MEETNTVTQDQTISMDLVSDQAETVDLTLGEIPLPESETLSATGEKRQREEGDANQNRSRSDFYCEVCDSHMGSQHVWDSHVKGKRHVRNVAKKPEERPSRVRTEIRNDIPAQIQGRLDKITEPIIGLDYVTEVQKANQKGDPSYICYLCANSTNVSNIIDHLLSTKHRVNCLKEEKPESYGVMETMTLTKRTREGLVEEAAVQLESEKGRGEIEVKIEKPKLDELPALKKLKTDNPYVVGSFGSYPNRNSYESYDNYNSRGINIEGMSFATKIQMLEELSTPVIKSDNECKLILKCINKLSQCLIQYKVHNLPSDVQMSLTQQMISGNMDVIENSLNSQGYGRQQSFGSGGGRYASYGMNSEGAVSYPMGGGYSRGAVNSNYYSFDY